MARPIPRDPPVTSATRSSREIPGTSSGIRARAGVRSILFAAEVRCQAMLASGDARRAMQPSSIDVIASTLGPALPGLGAFSSPDGALTLLFADIADAHAL